MYSIIVQKEYIGIKHTTPFKDFQVYFITFNNLSFSTAKGPVNESHTIKLGFLELHYLLVRTSEVLNEHKCPHTLPWEKDHDYEFRLDSKSRWPPLRKETEKLGYSTEARGNYIGLKSRY